MQRNVYKPGDLVACYITNTTVYEELLEWGIILEVSGTLRDILVLNNHGFSNWYPASRWRKLSHPPENELELILA